jgi:hypothetical protein
MLCCVAFICCATTNTAYSKNMVMPAGKHSTEYTIKWQKRIIRHDRWVIATAIRHNPQRVLFAQKQLEWTTSSLKDWRSQHQSHSSYGTVSGVCWSCWSRVASCESGNNPSEDTGNGFYGAVQFDYSTWIGSGGGRFADRADHATWTEQIIIAESLRHSRGLQPWPVCGKLY